MVMASGGATGSFTMRNLQTFESNNIIALVIALGLSFGIFALFSRSEVEEEREDGKEPPEIRSRIPYIGHLIGLLSYQVGYFQKLSLKCPSYKAFTLKVLANRIYVICDPALIQAAYKNSKVFDFTTFVVDSSKKGFEISEDGMKVIRGETAPGYDPKGPFLNGNNGPSFLNENHDVMYKTLSPGPGLLELNSGVLNVLAFSVNELGSEVLEISLYKWMRDLLTLATSSALYGPHDPLHSDPSLVDALWDFEENFALLMLEFLPTLIARKAYYGRANIKAAFANYYAKSHHLSASRLIQNRKTCSSKWNLSDDDIANTEISTLYLSTTNSAPTSFWLLVNILADPVLLAEIREEISDITTRDASKDGKERAVIDITLFQSRCPLLLASFRETLRLIDAATSIRSISQDILLTSPSSTSSYFLKKGNVIQLPSGITHNSPAIWGADVDSFKPLRFLPATKEKLDREQRRKQTQGYFPFGGGKHLCPGRHFATTEILAFVSVMLMGFEIEGSRVPERAFQKLGTGVRKPVGDVKVKLRRRKDWENVKWVFDVGGEVDFKCLVGEEDDF